MGDKAEQEKGDNPLWKIGEAEGGRCALRLLKNSFTFTSIISSFKKLFLKILDTLEDIKIIVTISGNMEEMHFSLLLPLRTAKILASIYKASIRRLRGERKKADQLGTLEPE